MKYEWDNNKRSANKEKHGLDFSDAPFVFENIHVTNRDDRYTYGEQRFKTYGALNLKTAVKAYCECLIH